jgi:hypothetical protein
MTGYFDPSKPHPCERLARISGQTNYWRLLAGIEEGADTTEDMAALSFARRNRVAPPELLEAYWGGIQSFRMDLCQYVFDAIDAAGTGVRVKDRVWVKASILDAFDLFTGQRPGLLRHRAAQYKVRLEDFVAARKLAEGFLYRFSGDIQPRWIRARLRE